ncbi:MAG TPA: PilZ domain-containing protein [Acidimicrobiia bacterium]
MPERLPSFSARQPVLLEVGAGGQLIGWRAAIEAVQGERLLLAASEGDPVPGQFREGAHVAVTSVTRSGVYTIDAIVARRSPTTLAVTVREDVEPVQRRQYVRVGAGPVLNCLLLDDTTNTFTPFEATVHDIGGGGIALDADVIAPRDAIVVCSLALPAERPLVAVGTVLEPSHRRKAGPRALRSGGEDDEYLLRVQFTAISEHDRERLIRFVFACMRGGGAATGDADAEGGGPEPQADPPSPSSEPTWPPRRRG